MTLFVKKLHLNGVKVLLDEVLELGVLIQFTVKNFFSIRDEQVLSMVSSKGEELQKANTFMPDAPATNRLLKSVAIYGANASGKSNLISALEVMQQVVTKSASWTPGDNIPVIPFLLDDKSKNEPTEFEVIFVSNKIRFQYGFSATSERIIEEWLYAFPKARSQQLFYRSWDEEVKKYIWDLGTKLTGKKQLWQDSTRMNALFLSTAVQLNSEQLLPVFEWFDKKLVVDDLSSSDAESTAAMCEDKLFKSKILKFLSDADLGIKDIEVKQEKIDKNMFPSHIPEYVRDEILESIKAEKFYKVRTVHKSIQGENVFFPMSSESDGTRTLFRYAGPLIKALENGKVIVIDELNMSLHPKMVEFLVKLFHNHEYNKKNAQLIFSSHETAALNQNIFRRDQIWFCEKNEDQVTSIFPLTDFRPRKGREDIEANYLAGRYGALPYLPSSNFIGQ